jgi:hypothetical protein
VEINSECDCDACTTFIYKQWMLFMGFAVVIHVRGSDSYIYIYIYIEDWNRKTVASSFLHLIG